MTKQERENWLINIENTAAYIAEENMAYTVDFILERYEVRSFDELASSELSAIWNELDVIAADLR